MWLDNKTRTKTVPRLSAHGNSGLDSIDTAKNFLRTGGNLRLQAARALAVLDEPVPVRLLAGALEVPAEALQREIDELTAGGVLDGGRFRDPALLDQIRPEVPIDWRRRVEHRLAGLLRADGAPDAVVARHLLAAGYARYPWAPAVLRAAGRREIMDEHVERAVEYLEFAYRITRDPARRASVATTLALLEWQTNPSRATRSFRRLVAALHRGDIPETQLAQVIRYLAWHGQVEEIENALDQLERSRTRTGLDDIRVLLACNQPGSLRHPRTVASEPDGTPSGPLVTEGQAARLLSGILARGATPDAVGQAQQILRRHRLDPKTCGALWLALDCLIHSPRLDLAASWSKALRFEADTYPCPTWHAIFAIQHAEVLLRLGDLDGAVEQAGHSLNQLRAENLGISGPRAVAVLVSALTLAGRYDEAAGQLNRPVPDAMAGSRSGLSYLRARGHYLLATGRLEQAMTDFTTCGAQMRRWNMDVPAVAPWRTDLAQALLRTGERTRARELAREHLELAAATNSTRTVATALHLIATTGAPRDRVRLLDEAVKAAHAGGDVVESATVTAGLGRALAAEGETTRSRPLLRRATRLARQCGAEPLRVGLDVAHPPAERISKHPERSTEPGALSPAELRVARLAAAGLPNRHIAAELSITSSTVEQHLTRVYRKLRVSSRSELRFAFAAEDTCTCRH